MLKSFAQLSLSFALISLTACSALQDKPVKEVDASTVVAAPQQADETETRFRDFDLEDDTLYDLLVAEFAARRNQIPVALVNYIQQARLTGDPDVIRQAIYVAQVANDKESINKLADLWVETDPNNPSAHQLSALQASIGKDYEKAAFHMDRVLTLGGRANVDGLALGSQSLSTEDKNTLRDLYENLLEKHPSNHDLRYSLAIIEKNLGNYDAALERVSTVIEAKPDLQQAYVLKSNILFEKKDAEQTFLFTEQAFQKFPRNHTLGRLYASLLIDQQRLADAEEVFRSLVNLYPSAPALKLSLALVTLENEKLDDAKTLLSELNRDGHHKDESNFYLARIADQEDDPVKAIEHYLAVGPSLHFESSIERAAFLLAKSDQMERAIKELEARREAHPKLRETLWTAQFKLVNSFEPDSDGALETLNAALEQLPNSQDLRYARAMVLDTNGDLAGMEYDLKYIIKLNPKHAVAMNALGYTLADKTERYKEALDFITLALHLEPDSPAILDSMGWVLYKLDRDTEALVYLLKAYEKYPDGEIGAHLGEVLFVNEEQEKAFEVWRDALQKDDTHPVLLETLERFAPELLPTKTSPEQPANSEETALPSTQES